MPFVPVQTAASTIDHPAFQFFSRDVSCKESPPPSWCQVLIVLYFFGVFTAYIHNLPGACPQGRLRGMDCRQSHYTSSCCGSTCSRTFPLRSPDDIQTRRRKGKIQLWWKNPDHVPHQQLWPTTVLKATRCAKNAVVLPIACSNLNVCLQCICINVSVLPLG